MTLTGFSASVARLRPKSNANKVYVNSSEVDASPFENLPKTLQVDREKRLYLTDPHFKVLYSQYNLVVCLYCCHFALKKLQLLLR